MEDDNDLNGFDEYQEDNDLTNFHQKHQLNMS